MQVSVARFQRLTRIVVFAAGFSARRFFASAISSSRVPKIPRPPGTLLRSQADRLYRDVHTFLVAQLALMQRTKRVVVVYFGTLYGQATMQ